MSARKTKNEGVVSLVKPEAPSIEEITLRDWFAAFAMQALIDKPEVNTASLAYSYADEMLKERKLHVGTR